MWRNAYKIDPGGTFAALFMDAINLRIQIDSSSYGKLFCIGKVDYYLMHVCPCCHPPGG